MPIFWKNIPGQERTKEVLSRAFDSKKLGQAYLFSGSAGVGKFPLALQCSAALLCEEVDKPCFQCNSCKKILSHSHPDFRYIFPFQLSTTQKSKKGLSESAWDEINGAICQKMENPFAITPSYNSSIPVDWIREINKTLARGPIQAEHLTVIIEGIDTFRPESANALLKSLEEPKENTHIFLLCRSLDRVLPTIRSRCQIFRFPELSESDLFNAIKRDHPGLTEDNYRDAVLNAQGSYGVAASILKDDRAQLQDWENQIYRLLFKKPQLSTALELESFVSSLDGSFADAESILINLILRLRADFLSSLEEALFSHKQVELLLKTLERAIISCRRHTALLTIFIELYLETTGIIYGKKS